MKLVVAGLSPREEATLGFFLSRNLSSLTWQSAPDGRAAALPKADIFLLDLASLGWAQWSEAAQTELLQWLHGSPAVLLVSANDQTWASSVQAEAAKRHSLVLLAKPYGSDSMRVALEKAIASVACAVRLVSAPPLAPPVVAPIVPAALVSPAMPVPIAPSPVVVPALPEEEPPGLSIEELQARLQAESDTSRYVFLRKLSDMLLAEQPFEVRFTMQNSLIVHPSDGWIVTNTPVMVIARVCQSTAMASAVTIWAIDAAQAEDRAQQLGMPLRELEVFLLELVGATLDAQPASGSTAS